MIFATCETSTVLNLDFDIHAISSSPFYGTKYNGSDIVPTTGDLSGSILPLNSGDATISVWNDSGTIKFQILNECGGTRDWSFTVAGNVYVNTATTVPIVPPLYIFYFDVDGSLPSGTTYTCASAAWYIDSALQLASAAVDTPRWNYDPITSDVTFLNEPVATNDIRNASAGGGAAGTPGTDPTNWFITTTGGGLVRTLAFGTEDGVPYVETAWVGVTVGAVTLSIYAEPLNGVAAAAGDVRTGSWLVKHSGGVLTGVTIRHIVNGLTGGGVGLPGTTVVIVPTGGSLISQRFDITATMPATTASVVSQISIICAAASTIDFAIRVALPQNVLAPGPSSLIVTTAAAVTRAACVTTVSGIAAATYDVDIARVSGTTNLTGVVVGGGGTYVVPTDVSPLIQVVFPA
jgi:hypothetical protein